MSEPRERETGLTEIGVKRLLRRMARDIAYPNCPVRGCEGVLAHLYNDDTTYVDGVTCNTCEGTWTIDTPLVVAKAWDRDAKWRWPRRSPQGGRKERE